MFKASAQAVPESKPSTYGFSSRVNNLEYPHRLNLYVVFTLRDAAHPFDSYDKPPLFDVTLEEFERCALDRLRILAEIESSSARGRSWDDTKTVIGDQCKKYLPLSATSAISVDRDTERRKDHLGHFVLRLAFCRS